MKAPVGKRRIIKWLLAKQATSVLCVECTDLGIALDLTGFLSQRPGRLLGTEQKRRRSRCSPKEQR